jgi:uncharacterized protein YycO
MTLKMNIYYRTYCLTIIFFIVFINTGCSPQYILQPTEHSVSINQDDPCWQHTLNTYSKTEETMTLALDASIDHYESLVEQSLTYRAETIKFAQQLKDDINQDKPLTGHDLDRLNRGMIAHLKLREKLYQVAKSHECWLNLSDDTFKQLGIEPISPSNQLKGVMLSLSAALMLYDNYLLAISIFEEDDKLRRFLNEQDSGYGIGRDELAKITQSYHSKRKRDRVRMGLKFYEQKLKQVSPTLQGDVNFEYLKSLISQSPSYNMTRKDLPLYLVGGKLMFMGEVTSDMLHRLAQDGINLFSKFFGNSIGLIETRKGKLYDRADILETVTHQLQAGDILLEKTPFRLTDKFIPGHWGHAAIWIGTEDELKNLGIWEHPLVKQYHQPIKENHLVVEALRPGVQMSALQQFLNIDDLAILRNTKLDKKELAERIILTLRQIGKEYDFNFDVETTDKIVCSELIYVVYTGISWPTEKTLGRFTISPDNVGLKALDGDPLTLIALFHDGKSVTHKPLELMSQLMESNKKKKEGSEVEEIELEWE